MNKYLDSVVEEYFKQDQRPGRWWHEHWGPEISMHGWWTRM